MNDHRNTFELTEPLFLRLFVKHEAGLRAYSRSILPDWNLVDEAMQEASVTMWQKRDQLREESGFAPWAKVILRFKCLRQIEKLRLERPILSDSMLATIATKGEARNTEHIADREKAFRTCFGLLPEKHQELLLAPHTRTVTVIHLAEKRNTTVNSLYKLLGRLRQKLSVCIRKRIASGALSS